MAEAKDDVTPGWLRPVSPVGEVSDPKTVQEYPRGASILTDQEEETVRDHKGHVHGTQEPYRP